MNAAVHRAQPSLLRLQLRSVPFLRPLRWVGRGALDLAACWPASVAHAALMVVLGWVLLTVLGAHPYFVAAAISGFLLGAPLMCTGIVELSRRRALREPTTFDGSLEPLARDGTALLKFGAVLTVFAVGWFLLSEVLLKSVFHVTAPSLADTFYRGFLDTANRTQLIAYAASGAALALIVFVLSVVSVPLIIDQHASASQAMRASISAVRMNPLAMLLWSALLVGLTAIGFATLLFGMLLVIPLLGHATWHAYRDLVRA